MTSPAQIAAATAAFGARVISRGDAWRAALDAADRAAWQPIETAPRDGTEVLLYQPGIAGGVWSDAWDDNAPGGPDWDTAPGFKPTHWRPLSTPEAA